MLLSLQLLFLSLLSWCGKIVRKVKIVRLFWILICRMNSRFLDFATFEFLITQKNSALFHRSKLDIFPIKYEFINFKILQQIHP